MQMLASLVSLFIAMSGHEPPASAVTGCAPTDGPAIDMRLDLAPGRFVRLSLFDEGRRRMAEGTATFAVGYPEGTGTATMVTKGGFAPLTARVVFDVSGVKVGDKLRGRLYYREADGTNGILPFSVQLKDGRQRCG